MTVSKLYRVIYNGPPHDSVHPDLLLHRHHDRLRTFKSHSFIRAAVERHSRNPRPVDLTKLACEVASSRSLAWRAQSKPTVVAIQLLPWWERNLDKPACRCCGPRSAQASPSNKHITCLAALLAHGSGGRSGHLHLTQFNGQHHQYLTSKISLLTEKQGETLQSDSPVQVCPDVEALVGVLLKVLSHKGSTAPPETTEYSDAIGSLRGFYEYGFRSQSSE